MEKYGLFVVTSLDVSLYLTSVCIVLSPLYRIIIIWNYLPSIWKLQITFFFMSNEYVP